MLLLGAAVLSGPGYAFLLAPVATLVALASDPMTELHRWHVVDIAAIVSLLGIVPLFAALRRPRQRALLVQASVATVALLVLFTVALPPHGTKAVPASLVLVALVLDTHPARRSLFTVRGQRRDRLATAVTLGAAPFLGWTLW